MRKKIFFFILSVFTVALLLTAVVTIKQFSDQKNLNEIKKTGESHGKEKTGLPAALENNILSKKGSKETTDDNGNISRNTRADQKTISDTVKKNKTPDPANSNVVLTASIAIAGKNQEIIYGPAKVSIKSGDSNNITVLDVLDATDLNYETSTRWPGFVEVIGGLENKGQSGWMYTVNDQIPMVSAAAMKVREGDRIIWWYTEDIKSKFPVWKDLTAINLSTP
jgi:hypothetical protein